MKEKRLTLRNFSDNFFCLVNLPGLVLAVDADVTYVDRGDGPEQDDLSVRKVYVVCHVGDHDRYLEIDRDSFLSYSSVEHELHDELTLVAESEMRKLADDRWSVVENLD